MLRFKQFISLLEAKIDDYKDKETSISTDHDPDATIKEPSVIIDHFHAHNPTQNISHTRWMIDQYKKGNIKQEDAPAMKDLLTNFNRYRDKLPKKRIEQYKTQGELQTALHPHLGTSNTEQKVTQGEKALKEGSTVVYDSPNISVRHIETEDAAKYDARGLPWCTARQDSRNMFNHYKDKTNNRFYHVDLKNEKYPNEKLGIGIGAGELQDQNNTKKEGDDLRELCDRNPELRDVKELQGSSIHLTKPENVEHHIHDLMDNDSDGTTEEIDNHPRRYSQKVHDAVMRHGLEMDKAEEGDSSVKNSKFKSVLKELASNTSDKDTLTHLSSHPDDTIKAAVGRNYSTPLSIRKQLASHKNPLVRGNVDIDSGGFPIKDRHEFIKNETHPAVLAKWATRCNKPDMMHAILDNPNADEHVIHQVALNASHYDEDVIKRIALNPKTKSDTLETLADSEDCSSDTHKAIINHPNVTDDVLGVVARRSHDPEVHKAMSKKLMSIVNDNNTNRTRLADVAGMTTDPEVHNAILNHPNVGRYALNKVAVITSDANALSTIANHKKADENTLGDLANNPSTPPALYKTIIEHPNVGGYTLSRIVRLSDDANIQKKIASHRNISDGTLESMSNTSKNPEVQKKIIERKDGINGLHLDNIANNTNDPSVLHHILDHHNNKLRHGTLRIIKQKLHSDAKDEGFHTSYNSIVGQKEIDAVKDSLKPKKPEPDSKYHLPFDLFDRDSWAK
jgi:hypothetical protein